MRWNNVRDCRRVVLFNECESSVKQAIFSTLLTLLEYKKKFFYVFDKITIKIVLAIDPFSFSAHRQTQNGS